MNKRGVFELWSDWAELIFLILLFFGLIVGVMSPSAVVTYLIAFASGMLAGRVMYERKNKGRAPYLLIIVGFIMGYVIGTFQYGDRKITFLLFVFGAILCYYLFSKKIIRDTII